MDKAQLTPAAPFACVTRAWEAHEAELRSFLRHRLAEPAAADDVLQEVFVKAVRAGQDFCRLESPRAWLFQVARNALVDRLRASHHVEPLEDHQERLAAPEADGVAPVDALTECLARVLAELSPDDADVLRRCDIDGTTQRAYAELHGLGLPAVKSRLQRARQRLRDRMAQVCRVRFDPEDGRVCGHDGRAERAGNPPK